MNPALRLSCTVLKARCPHQPGKKMNYDSLYEFLDGEAKGTRSVRDEL